MGLLASELLLARSPIGSGGSVTAGYGSLQTDTNAVRRIVAASFGVMIKPLQI